MSHEQNIQRLLTNHDEAHSDAAADDVAILWLSYGWPANASTRRWGFHFETGGDDCRKVAALHQRREKKYKPTGPSPSFRLDHWLNIKMDDITTPEKQGSRSMITPWWRFEVQVTEAQISAPISSIMFEHNLSHNAPCYKRGLYRGWTK